MLSYKTIPGVNIRWPWSKLLLEGTKTVETRSYPLPTGFVGKEIAVIETPGPNGKKNGIPKSAYYGTDRL